MSFYYNGEVITNSDFIRIYKDSYFLGQPKIPNFPHVQSSVYVENEIDNILRNGIKTREDFGKVMAWKIGKIKHAQSQGSSSFVFAKGWQNCLTQNPLHYNKPLDLNSMWNYINSSKFQSVFNKLSLSNPQSIQDVLDALAANSPAGIGSVYLMTILYFLTHGQLPIYDRFAATALEANKLNIPPKKGTKINLPSIPDKKSPKFKTICKDIYLPYINELDNQFKNWKNDRNVDRALWVYGHGF